MVATTTSLILIRHYQARVGGLYLAGTNMIRSGHCLVNLVAAVSVEKPWSALAWLGHFSPF